MPTPTSTSAELKRRRSDGGRSQKLILFKRGKAISGVIVKALYLLLLFLTKELRLCHQGQEYTLTLSGVRGTSIVDRTHVLVVERFSSSRFFKVHMTQKKIWHLSKETSLQIVLKHFEEGIPKVAFLRRRDSLFEKTFHKNGFFKQACKLWKYAICFLSLLFRLILVFFHVLYEKNGRECRFIFSMR